MLSDRTATIMESVPHGTLFIDTSGKGYVPDGTFYVASDLTEALDHFIRELAIHANTQLTLKPLALVQELVNKHGLVIIYVGSRRITRPIKRFGKGNYAYEVEGYPDKVWTLDHIRGMITHGIVKSATRVRVFDMDKDDFVNNFTPARNISMLSPLFSLATPELSSIKPNVTLVAKNQITAVQAMATIDDYFDIRPDEDVVFTNQCLDAQQGKGKVFKFSELDVKAKGRTRGY